MPIFTVYGVQVLLPLWEHLRASRAVLSDRDLLHVKVMRALDGVL